MTREIKFRAWDKEKGMSEMSGIKLPNTTDPNRHLGVVIMQYTGLKDKNGKEEIYEGDCFGIPRVGQESEFIGFVEFDTDLGAFTIARTNGGWEYLHNFINEHKTAEIIGNIYENGNLLKK